REKESGIVSSRFGRWRDPSRKRVKSGEIHQETTLEESLLHRLLAGREEIVCAQFATGDRKDRGLLERLTARGDGQRSQRRQIGCEAKPSFIGRRGKRFPRRIAIVRVVELSAREDHGAAHELDLPIAFDAKNLERRGSSIP